MYMLAGVFGMMALGSLAVAFASAADPTDDEESDVDPACDPDEGADGFLLDDPAVDPLWTMPDTAALEQGRSLFSRMGLINMGPGAGPDMRPGEVLLLEAYRAASDGEGGDTEAPAPQTLMDYDSAEDQLLVIYDDSAGQGDPELELAVRAEDPDTTDVVVDGTVLASLPTAEAPPTSAIVLVGESTAAALDLVA